MKKCPLGKKPVGRVCRRLPESQRVCSDWRSCSSSLGSSSSWLSEMSKSSRAVSPAKTSWGSVRSWFPRRSRSFRCGTALKDLGASVTRLL